jgi:hypothetical protein
LGFRLRLIPFPFRPIQLDQQGEYSEDFKFPPSPPPQVPKTKIYYSLQF